MVQLLRTAVVATALALASTNPVLAASEAMGTACYRRTIPSASHQCPKGYDSDNALTCWGECPLDFPVECGMECIPQNQDCTKEIVAKTTAVVEAFLKTASLSVSSGLVTASKGMDIALRCGQQLYTITEKVVSYVNTLEAKFPSKTKDQIVSLAMQADIVAIDLPLAVTTCFNLPVPANMGQIGNDVVQAVKIIVQQIANLNIPSLTPSSFANVTKTAFRNTPAANVLPVNPAQISGIVNGGVACGKDIKNIIDQVVALAKQIKAENPQATESTIRILLNASPLLLQQLPDAIKTCGSSAADIRKLVDTIIAQISASADNNGKPVDKTTMALSIASMALNAISSLDPTGIAHMAEEFVQPLCDPTLFAGTFADGKASAQLGLHTMGQAFDGSDGTWANAGDGMVKINFVSTDYDDVTVNVKSGGKVIDKVSVDAGRWVQWTRPLSDMEDKTLYLDRWRPGMFGLPGTGGGSLLVWVPHAGLNGHLEINAFLQAS